MSSSRVHRSLTGCADLLGDRAPPGGRNPGPRRAGRSRRRASSCARRPSRAARSAAAAAVASAVFGVLGRHPDLDAVVGVTCAVQFCGSIVAWLRNGTAYSASTRLAALGERRVDIAVLADDRGFRRGEAGAQRTRRCWRSTPGRCPVVPGRPAAHRPPSSPATSCRRRPRPRSAAHDAAERPSCRAICALVEGFRRAAEHRALGDRGIEHVRQPHIDARRSACPVTLSAMSSRLCGVPSELPVVRVLELRPRSAARILAAASATSPKRSVRPLGSCVIDAVGGDAFGGRHVPALRRGGDQHLPRRRAGLAQVFLRGRESSGCRRSTCRPRRGCAADFPRGETKLGAHLAPVAFELLGDQHRQAGRDALPHLGARDADDRPCHRAGSRSRH